MPDREGQQALIDKRKRGWFWDYNDLFDSSLSEHAIIVRLFVGSPFYPTRIRPMLRT